MSVYTPFFIVYPISVLALSFERNVKPVVNCQSYDYNTRKPTPGQTNSDRLAEVFNKENTLRNSVLRSESD